MTEAATRWKMPWGLALTLALVAGAVAVRAWPALAVEEHSRWDALGSAALIVAAAFLAMRWLQNYFWGVMTAAVLLAHPLLWLTATANYLAPRYEALELVKLAVAIAGWRLAYRPDFAWLQWLLLVSVAIGAMAAAPAVTRDLAWPSNFLMLAALPLGSLLGVIRWRRGDKERPCPGNLVGAFVASPVILAAALTLLPLELPGWDLSEGLNDWRPLLAVLQRPFDPQHLERWCWPNSWTMLALAAWGLIRTVWRGWRELKHREPPTAWLLTLFVVATAVGLGIVPFEMVEQQLALLAVLLSIFGIADVFRGISERLVLLPPEDRQD